MINITEWAVKWLDHDHDPEFEPCDDEAHARDLVALYPAQTVVVARVRSVGDWHPVAPPVDPGTPAVEGPTGGSVSA